MLPPIVFVIIHLALLLIGAYLAYRSFGAGASGFGWAFTLYAVAELFYLTYHLDITVILFAHTVAEVLDAVAFLMLFSNGMRLLGDARGAQRAVPASGMTGS